MKKVKKVSKIAKGRGAKAAVLKGKKEKTVGGLTSANLVKNKRGKVVSKNAAARGKKAFASSPLKKWSEESTKGFGHHWLLRGRRQQCPGQSTLRQSEVHPGR